MTNPERLSSSTASQLARLMAMPLSQAFDLARNTLDEGHIEPIGCTVIRPMTTRLLATAHAAGLTDVHALLPQQRRVLCDLTGLPTSTVSTTTTRHPSCRPHATCSPRWQPPPRSGVELQPRTSLPWCRRARAPAPG
jgi:hypothetical protein